MIETLDYIWSVLETWGGLEGRESKLEEGDGTFYKYVVGCWLEIVQTRSMKNLQIVDDDQADDDIDLIRLMITMMMMCRRWWWWRHRRWRPEALLQKLKTWEDEGGGRLEVQVEHSPCLVEIGGILKIWTIYKTFFKLGWDQYSWLPNWLSCWWPCLH